MKILNLYSGIGGNRKLWGDTHDIVAIEDDEFIAKVYKENFPKDKVFVCDAHSYLLNHYNEFDFIWSSPPCPSHSRSRFWGMNRGYKPIYPDMRLYQEILLLKHYYKGKYCVENVIPFYSPLIEPQKISRHCFWANFIIHPKDFPPLSKIQNDLGKLEKHFGFEIKKYEFLKGDKRILLRNCVEPELGLHIFQEAFREHKQLF